MPKFPYEKTSIPFSKTFLKFKNSPILKVGILSESGQLVKVETYIDTGAQVCMIDNSYAKYLGIKDYKQTKSPEDTLDLSGIGGKKPENIAYFHDLKLVVFKDQKHLELKNALQIIDTKIGFLERPIAVAGILGVYGFLDHFTFLANIPDSYFEIEPKF
mgnify:FL=1